MDLVLESPGNFSGKSWNFLLGYDAGGRHNGVGVGTDVEICTCSHLYRVTELLRYSQYSVTHSLTAHLYCIVHPGILPSIMFTFCMVARCLVVLTINSID